MNILTFLKIARMDSDGTVYLNRLNPLFWVFIVYAIVLTPILVMFYYTTIQSEYSDIWSIIKTGKN